MAIVTARSTVTTTASKIAENTTANTTQGDYIARSFAIKNMTRTDIVYFGPSGVTTGNGWAWETTDGPISIDLEPGEELWAVVPTTSQVLHVLSQGR